MTEIGENQLRRVRLRFIDLIKSFFVAQPDAECLSRWRGTFAALSRQAVSPSLDEAVRQLSSQLSEKKLEELQDEYYALFTDPFGSDHLNLMASYYLDGRNYGESMVALKDFLARAGLSKIEGVCLSEDSLSVLLDVLAALIEQEKEGSCTQAEQDELVNRYLDPFLMRLARRASENQSAQFYRACINFCKGYLELEKGLTEQAS